jgi:hypothetical protein
MAFNDTTLQDNPDMGAGEVIKASPFNVSAFEIFEDGLVEGRFCKYDTGSIDNLDSSDTPVIAGIARRKITGEIGTGIYSTTGQEIDQVAEVINFGFATVTVTDAASPAKYDAVNVINDGTADAGKATEAAVAAEIISAGDVVFWEQKATGVWLVRFNKYL